MAWQAARSERVDDERAIRLEQARRRCKGLDRLLGPVEMGEDARQHREREALRSTNEPHVADHELDPAVVARGPQRGAGCDPPLRSLDE